MYAVFTTGGKQYKVSPGDVIYVEKLEIVPEQSLTFDNVLILGKDDGAVVGSPIVKGATVVAKAVKNGKGRKITVFTYRAKKGSERKMGHRQPYTKLEITEIKA